VTRRRGDGFLCWLGFTAVGGALYASLAGFPSSFRDVWLLTVVPVVFGLVMSVIREIGDRL
jgi:hypothetical protein